MKKSLIALAVLGAMSATASAQSSVTLYGIIDIGVQWIEKGVNTAPSGSTPSYNAESAVVIDGGYQSGSRFGLRGAEALGGNWAAVFALEGGFDPSTGMSGQGSRLFGRQAYAGLRHNAGGTVAFGRFATPSSGTGDFDLFGFVDPFGTGWGINSLGSTFIPSNALREDNAVLWASPSWAGFKFAAMYSGNINGAENLPSGNNTEAFTLAGNFNWGILGAAVTYDQVMAPNVPAGTAIPTYGNPDQKMLQLGLVVNLKVVKLHGAYASQDNIRFTTAGGTNPGAFSPVPGAPFDNQAFMFGVSLNLLNGTLLASYQMADADNVNGTTATGATYSFEPDYNVWGIGWSYAFSRRTNMYIGYGQSSWDGNISQAGVVTTGSANRFDQKQFALGIRHLF
jgi:general bacterial porin, GBP family